MAGTLLCCAIVSLLMYTAKANGVANLTLSRNPVYSGELFQLTCNYGSDNVPIQVTVDAFKNEQKIGSLWCRVPGANTTGDGVFNGKSFFGCPSHSPTSNNVSVSMIALPSLELDFNCTVHVMHKDFNQYTLRSARTSLVVHVLPAVPTFTPEPVIFNEDDSATILCEAPNGKPAAFVELTISDRSGTKQTTLGNNSASLTLRAPIVNWHNATAVCQVTNHNHTNMMRRSSVKIQHINCNSNNVSVTQNYSINSFDCSAYVRGYPTNSYVWSVPHDLVVTNDSVLRSQTFTTLEWKAGLFQCTATNGGTRKVAVAVFTVDDQGQFSVNCTIKMSTAGASTSCDMVNPWTTFLLWLCVILCSFLYL